MSCCALQFDERLLVHVKEHGANGWRDCEQCCRSQSGYMLRDSDCNDGFITSSLYSYIERLRPLNAQSLGGSGTVSRVKAPCAGFAPLAITLIVLCSFTNQVPAELDLLRYWKENTAYRKRSVESGIFAPCCTGCLPVKSER